MKNTLSQIAKGAVIILILVLIFIGFMNIYATYNSGCTKGDDECLQVLIDLKRSQRDEKVSSLRKVLVDTENLYNDDINAIKGMFSTGYAVEQIKEGKKQNVPAELLSLKSLLIPPVSADTLSRISDEDSTPEVGVAEMGLIDTTPISISNNTYAPSRYRKVLASVGSPYSDTPIEQYCQNAKLGVLQCDMLVGIAHAESSSGTDFACNGKSREDAVVLGQTYYFNPVGIKDFTNDGTQKNPDMNGCYLRQFASWDDFWQWYPSHMAKAYKLNNISNPYQISGCYVKGNCSLRSPSWSNRVNGFIQQINNA